MSENRICCNCRHNIRTGKPGEVTCNCEIDGHYINYAECMTGWCRRWASDAAHWKDKEKSDSEKTYYEKNRKKILARQKAYNARHKEEKAEYDKKRKQKIRKPDGMVMGVKRENKSIYVARIPGRKKLCLVCGEGNTGTIIATFRSIEEVKLFEEYINFVCFGLSKKKEDK